MKAVFLYTEKPALLLTTIAVCACQVTKPQRKCSDSASLTKYTAGFKVFVVCMEPKFAF